ncbi:UNVERIFIED_CONTAM: hypothetical protein Sindi_1378000, partial [Sesamum indicum]
MQRVFQITTPQRELLTDNIGVQEEFVNVFQTLIRGEAMNRDINLQYLAPWVQHRLTISEANELVRLIQRREVYDALLSISNDKAPGPDRYLAYFSKSAWPLIGENITDGVLDFFHTGRILKQINAALLVLIPKVHSLSTAANFRPIACCNVLYKLIAKILVKRVQGVMGALVHISQNAFIPGRKIVVNILLVQKLLAAYNQKQLLPCCAVKVDLQKAYDM